MIGKCGKRGFLAAILCTFLFVPTAASAHGRDGASVGKVIAAKMVSPARGGLLQIRPGVTLVVPRHALLRRGKVTVRRLSFGGYQIGIAARWRGKLFLRTRSHGAARAVMRSVGGLYFARKRHSPSRGRAVAASIGSFLGSRIAGSICLKIGADGAIIVDGEFVALCLLVKGDIYLAKEDAYLIAQALGADCAAAIFHSSDVKIPYTYFKGAACNEPPSAHGPTNGQPTIVATLTPTSPRGIPLGSPAPSSPPPRNPAPSSPSSPSPLPAGEFYVMNADGGIYWRSSPDWNTPVAVPGNGFYPGTVIQVHCYGSGAANVPGSSDSMWEQASRIGGPGSGSGWINEHFINDGQSINQPSPGVPACSSPAPPQTWAEQETPNHPVNSFTNYHNASGMGQPVAAGQWVQVSCKVYDPTIGSVNPDGYWYRIASAPWSNVYYSPANTFMNGDPYGGPYTHNTDFNVPNC